MLYPCYTTCDFLLCHKTKTIIHLIKFPNTSACDNAQMSLFLMLYCYTILYLTHTKHCRESIIDAFESLWCNYLAATTSNDQWLKTIKSRFWEPSKKKRSFPFRLFLQLDIYFGFVTSLSFPTVDAWSVCTVVCLRNHRNKSVQLSKHTLEIKLNLDTVFGKTNRFLNAQLFSLRCFFVG